MIDYTEIEKEIMTMESDRDTSYAALGRLAPLYTAMIYKSIMGKSTIQQAQPIAVTGDSDFIAAVNGKDSVAIYAVLDELMSALSVVNPRLYDATMRKLEAL